MGGCRAVQAQTARPWLKHQSFPEELVFCRVQGESTRRILILGAGAAGTMAANLLRRELPEASRVDLDQTREVTIGGMFKAMRDPRVRQGLGVLMELTRALGAAKDESCPLPSASKKP